MHPKYYVSKNIDSGDVELCVKLIESFFQLFVMISSYFIDPYGTKM